MKNILLIFLGIFALLSCKLNKDSDRQTTNDQLIKDSLTSEIADLGKDFFNGLGVAIVDSAGVRYEKGIGFSDVNSKKPYTVHTVQPIASVSKTLIGIALMKAQEMELLNLDDPVNEFLPFKVENPSHPNDPITIRHLATHTSSILDNDNYESKSYVLRSKADSTGVKFENIPQNFNSSELKVSLSEYLKNYLSKEGEWYSENAFSKDLPGQMFEYTNVGASLAAYIIEVVSNQSYAEFTTEHILEPLGMNQSAWSYDDVDLDHASSLYSNQKTTIPLYSLISYPDGGLLTNVSDLAKYLVELINGYSGSGTLLRKESYAELFEIQLEDENFVDRDPNHPYDDEYNSGIFMGFSGTGNVGHTGGDPGVSTLMFFNSKDKIGRILLVNTNIENQEGVNAYYDIYNTLEKYAPKLQ